MAVILGRTLQPRSRNGPCPCPCLTDQAQRLGVCALRRCPPSGPGAAEVTALTPGGRAEAECPPQPARLASCLEVHECRRRALATRNEPVSVTPTSGKGALAAEESETLDPLPSLSDANFNRVGLMPQRDQIWAPGRGPLWLCLCPPSPLASLPPGHPAHVHPTPFSPQSSLTRNSLFGSSYSFTQQLKK